MAEYGPLLQRARERLLRLHFDAHAGHLGGNFSSIDILMMLHHGVMREEDRFILSKGHSAGALYVTLWSQGKLSDEDLATFTRDDSLLPAHPSGSGIPGLLFSTGSLGHGPSLSAGLALADRNQGKGNRTYCLCSDGEWQEGSCWEALIFAVHQRLDNLFILIDQNGLQGFGTTQDVISCGDLTERLASFGAEMRKADGHDPLSILEALKPSTKGGKPIIVIFETVKGRGLHFEGCLESHYLPLTEEEYRVAGAKLMGEEAL